MVEFKLKKKENKLFIPPSISESSEREISTEIGPPAVTLFPKKLSSFLFKVAVTLWTIS